eukprot:m.1497791 g.1497791  ORF g.1497791 m.1497791 type:complete len:147 (-) comp25200_c0_seq15:155-595(-)
MRDDWGTNAGELPMRMSTVSPNAAQLYCSVPSDRFATLGEHCDSLSCTSGATLYQVKSACGVVIVHEVPAAVRTTTKNCSAADNIVWKDDVCELNHSFYRINSVRCPRDILSHQRSNRCIFFLTASLQNHVHSSKSSFACCKSKKL